MASTTFTFTVDSASTAWTPGPVAITKTQSLLISASGYAQWTAAPKYSQPEGGYANDGYPMSHHLDIGDLGKPNPANPLTNVPGLCLAILAVPSGIVPSPLAPGAGRGDALEPRWNLASDGVTRVALFYPSDLSNKTFVEGPWDVYFGYNDGDYSDNNGSFSVTATVADVDLQSPGQVIGLPGHMTQEDIDEATFCSFSGLLTPGNRLRSPDGRPVADVFAPFKRGGPKEF